MRERATMRASLLFAHPSALGGIARILDFGGTLNEYNTANSEAQADLLAACADWLAVGDDLWAALRTYEDQHVMDAAQPAEASQRLGRKSLAEDAAVQRHEPEDESSEATQLPERDTHQASIVASLQASLHRGPIPDPDTLARYEKDSARVCRPNPDNGRKPAGAPAEARDGGNQ